MGRHPNAFSGARPAPIRPPGRSLPASGGVRRLAAWAFLLLASIGLQAKAPAVSGLGYRYDGRQVLVSFSLERTFDREDLKEAILSTRSITFTYKVQLVRHRAAWKDAVVARTKLERTVVYDNLTRQFTVESSVDGREAEKRTVETWEEMAALLSSVRDLPLASVADLTPQDRYSVRAKVHLLSDSFLWIIPWDLETDWESLRLKTP